MLKLAMPSVTIPILSGLFLVSAAVEAQRFKAASLLHVPTIGASHASNADVDGDGDSDLLLVPHGLFRNEGNARLSQTVEPIPGFHVHGGTLHARFVDYDYDGDLDIVAHPLRLLDNDGSGHFTDVTAWRVQSAVTATWNPVCVDVDTDGDVDLWLGSNELLLNDGSGHFTLVTNRISYSVASNTCVADFDGDGDDDILLLNSIGHAFLINHGAVFADEAAARLPALGSQGIPVAIDIDGDGDMDFIAVNALSATAKNAICINDGSGHFSLAPASRIKWPAGPNWVRAVATLDADGDGDEDLVLGTEGQDRIYLNDGKGTFIDQTATFPLDDGAPIQVITGEYNGDKSPDILILSKDTTRLLINDGRANFTELLRSPIIRGSRLFLVRVTGDINGDGSVDLMSLSDIQAPGTEGHAIFINNGEGQLIEDTGGRLPPLIPATNERLLGLELGDIDGDGDLDAHYRTTMFQDFLLTNDGSGRFTDVSATHLPLDIGHTKDSAFVDLDGDGDLDLVTVGFSVVTAVQIFENDGSGRFTDVSSAVLTQTPHFMTSVEVGDIDSDGDIDLLTMNGDLGLPRQHRLLINDGLGTFSDETTTRLPTATEPGKGYILADFNGDGSPDILSIGKTRLHLFTNDGSGHYSAKQSFYFGVSPRVIAGDVDEDGDIDLWIRDTFGASIYLNDGQGAFVPAGRPAPYNQHAGSRLDFADFDDDGDLDLLRLGGSPAWEPVELPIVTNLHRQIEAPYYAMLGAPHTITVHSQPGYATGTVWAIGAVSTATTRIDLGDSGVWRLQQNSMLLLPSLAIPAPGGSRSMTIQIPNQPALKGSEFFFQFLFADGSGMFHTSNLLHEKIL